MEFKVFKEKIIQRKELITKVNKARSEKEKNELIEQIGLLEKEISGRSNISELQFNSRLANFFQISKDEFAKIILPLCSSVGQKISYYKDEKSGMIKGLKFEGFSSYLFLLNADNFSLKCLYDQSSQQSCWNDLFSMFPTLEAKLWNYMHMKSNLLNKEYAEILNEKLISDRNLIIKLAEEKSKLREQEIAKLKKSNAQISQKIQDCKNGEVCLFD